MNQFKTLDGKVVFPKTEIEEFWVLTDGQKYLSLDYKYKDYNLCDKVWEAEQRGTKKEAIESLRDAKRRKSSDKTFYKGFKPVKYKVIAMEES